MANYFVDWQTGNDTNNGTAWATPFKTFEKAWLLASGNSSGGTVDYVFVAPGVYFLTTPDKNAKSGKNVVFFGFGGVSLIVGSLACAMRYNGNNAAVFHGISLSRNAISVDNTTNYTNNFRFRNCGIALGCVVAESTPVNAGAFGLQFADCFCEGDINTAADGVNSPLNWQGFNVTPVITYYLGGLVGNKTPTAYGMFPELAIMPSKVQYTAGGASFLAPSTTYANNEGLFTRHDSQGVPARKQKFAGGIWKLDSTGPAATFDFIDNDRIILTSGDNGQVLSPVMFFGAGINLRRISLALVEFNFLSAYQVIDSTPATVERTIEYRISDTPFLQEDVSLPWVTVNRDADMSPVVTGKYLQLRLTFALGAVG